MGAQQPPETAPTVPSSAPSPGLAPPPGNPRFPLFDGLRGLAVLGVLVYHSAEFGGSLGVGVDGRAAEVFGDLGPPLFFALSGFLLYRPYVAARVRGRPATPVSRFLWRRALRIVPAYYVILTLLAIFPGVVGVFSGDWWRYYVFVQPYSGATLGLGIPVAWTLCAEVGFYLLLPWWAAALRRFGPRPQVPALLRQELPPLALLCAGGVTVQVLGARHDLPYLLGISLAGQCCWMGLGMALAVLSVADAQAPLAVVGRLCRYGRLRWMLAGVAFGGLVVLVPRGGLFGLIAQTSQPQGATRTLPRLALTAFVTLVLVAPAAFERLSGPATRALFARGPLQWLGVISYSAYLWHFTVIQFLAVRRSPGFFSATGLNLQGHVRTATTLVLFVAGLGVTVILSVVSYRAIELPFLRRKESRILRAR